LSADWKQARPRLNESFTPGGTTPFQHPSGLTAGTDWRCLPGPDYVEPRIAIICDCGEPANVPAPVPAECRPPAKQASRIVEIRRSIEKKRGPD